MFDLLTGTLTLPIYVSDAIFSVIYGGRLLKSKYPKRVKFSLWISIYLSVEAVLYKVVDAQPAVLRILIELVLLGILELLFFEGDFNRQIFVAISFIAGKELIRNIGSVGYYLISHVTWNMFESLVLEAENLTVKKANIFLNIYLLAQSLVSVGIYVGLMFTYLSVLSKKYIYKGYEPTPGECVFLLLPCVTGLGVSLTLKVIILKINERLSLLIYDKVPEVLIWIIVICLLLLGSIIAAMILFQCLIERNEERREQTILEKQVEQLHREIEDVENIYSDLWGLKHDMRNHLNNIMHYVRNAGNDTVEIDGYLDELGNAVNRLDFSSKSGNPITDIIIYQRTQEAKNGGISFEVDFVAPDPGLKDTDYVAPDFGHIEAGFVVPNSGRIDIYDIAVILDNALDNAFEACRKVNGAREITLKSYMKGNLYFIEIENVFDGKVTFDKDTGLPVTGKTDKHLHGIGMSNIQKCARKYMGDIDIEIKSEKEIHRFILTVMMNTKCARQ